MISMNVKNGFKRFRYTRVMDHGIRWGLAGRTITGICKPLYFEWRWGAIGQLRMGCPMRGKPPSQSYIYPSLRRRSMASSLSWRLPARSSVFSRSCSQAGTPSSDILLVVLAPKERYPCS